MVLGIPPYRLPRDIIDREIDAIERMGVDIRLNTRVGKDISLDELRNDYDAIYVALGAHKEWALEIENEDARGVISGIGMLREVGLGREIEMGKNVVVIGGGNTAIDAARTAARFGAKVTIVYRRERKDMPAHEEEIEEALEEGIALRVLESPINVIVNDDKVAGLRCSKMSLGAYDDSGRRRPLPIEGSEFDIQCDMIITAIGQGPETDFLSDAAEKILERNGTIRIDRWNYSTQVEGVFAGGDAARGPQTVIRAIADGKETAGAIDRYLMGSDRLASIISEYEYGMTLPDNQEPMERVAMRKRNSVERNLDFLEVAVGYSEEDYRLEAGRCLRCDIRETDDEEEFSEGGEE